MSQRTPVKRRRYDNRGRQAAALQRRLRILDAARDLFTTRGYAATAMRDIADEARVSVKTVEAALGTKANVLKVLVDIAIAGDDQPIAIVDRPVMQRMRETEDLDEFLSLYAGSVSAISARLGPISRVVDQAAGTDADIAQLQQVMRDNRLFGARHTAASLSAKLARDPDTIDVDAAVDVLYLFNDPAIYDVLVRERGWSPPAFSSWLAATYGALLIPE